MRIEITYLLNSGFAVKIEHKLMIFDFYSNTPANGKAGLAGGVIDPTEIKGETVYVFVSHAHYDHYNPVIFDWAKHIKNIEYILSDDIKSHAGAYMLAPDKTYDIAGMRIETLKSTDEGVAFLIETDGITVYFAGDLNWWHWEGEDPDWNRQMAADYKAQTAKLAGRKIDIAFVPIDPRLNNEMYWGAKLLLDTADVGALIPMHYGSQGARVESLLKSGELTDAERRKIIPPMKRGQTISIEV